MRMIPVHAISSHEKIPKSSTQVISRGYEFIDRQSIAKLSDSKMIVPSADLWTPMIGF